MAKMQRVSSRVSLIYKTAFLFHQKVRSVLRASHQYSLMAGEKAGS
jgi:hypothetical protein